MGAKATRDIARGRSTQKEIWDSEQAKWKKKRLAKEKRIIQEKWVAAAPEREKERKKDLARYKKQQKEKQKKIDNKKGKNNK